MDQCDLETPSMVKNRWSSEKSGTPTYLNPPKRLILQCFADLRAIFEKRWLFIQYLRFINHCNHWYCHHVHQWFIWISIIPIMEMDEMDPRMEKSITKLPKKWVVNHTSSRILRVRTYWRPRPWQVSQFPLYIGADFSHGLVEVSSKCFFMNCRNLRSGQVFQQKQKCQSPIMINNGHLLEFLERIFAFHGDSS